MTCPHCSQTISGKQRTNFVCGLCKKEFAFEPKGSPLRLHDLRFRKVAEHVGAGGFKFTSSQLGTALLRRPVVSWALGWVQGMMALFLVGLGLFVLLTFSDCSKARPGVKNNDPGTGIGFVITLAGGIWLAGVLNSKPPSPPTDTTLRQEILPRWQAIYGELPRGLIADEALPDLTEEDRPRDDLRGVVVCPERAVLVSLLANGVPRDLRLGLLSPAPPADAWEQSLREQLRKNPRLPILLLHDASAEGVVLVRDLPQILGLGANHRIFDLGLNPRKSIEKNRTIILRQVPAELRARLDREAVGADAAGSRPIRRGRAQVTPEELAWLKAGNCSPILAVPPVSLVKRLKFTLAKFSPRRTPSQEEASLLRRLSAKNPTGAEATAAGFMSEPA